MSESKIVGSAEIGRFLNISRQRVTQLQNEPDFPKPIATLAMGKVYGFDGIERWSIDTGRRQTFRDYLDDLMADDADDVDGDIDPEATKEQFLTLIEPYGYTLDNAIPGTFIEILRKSL